MKFNMFIAFIVVLFLSSCQTDLPTSTITPILSPTVQPTEIFVVVTETGDPTLTSEPTDTLSPTRTKFPTFSVRPSETPIPYPETMEHLFTNIQVISSSKLKYMLHDFFPNENNGEPNINGCRGTIMVNGSPYGAPFHLIKELNPGEGVYFTFKFSDTNASTTWAFEKVGEQGKQYIYKGSDYYSFAIELNNHELITHTITGANQKDENIDSDITLVEDTWYNFAFAIDKDKNYIVKIWDPDNSQNQFLYTKPLPNGPDSNNFISWIGQNQVLNMENISVFQFDSFNQ